RRRWTLRRRAARGGRHARPARGATPVIRVMIADDHGVVREGLARLLGTFDDIEVAATARDGAEAVEVATAQRPDVVVMDLSMPDVDGAEATRRIVATDPSIQVVILTSLSDRREILG